MDQNNPEKDMIYLEKENNLNSKKNNKKNNKPNYEEEIIKLKKDSYLFIFQTRAYGLLHGKLNINMTTEEKKEFINKYWIIKPKKKYKFYGKRIKDIWKDDAISKLQYLIGILMVFKDYLTQKDIERFDNYFPIRIRSNERKYYKKTENGKILFIGGDLKCQLGEMLKNEFENCEDKDLPIYMTIMVYDEYEKIELEAIDYCDKIPEHNGFLKFPNVFHKNFPKTLSTKVQRIKNEKMAKKEKLKKEDEDNKKNCININYNI